MKRTTILAAAILLAGPFAGVAAAQMTAASKSLTKCQATVQKETAKYAVAVQKSIGGCLQNVAKRVVQANEATPNVSRALGGCANQFFRLGRTDGGSPAAKMATKIRGTCDPAHERFRGDHGEDDITGAGAPAVEHPLNAAAIGAMCESFADGSGNLTEWIECLQGAAECQGRQNAAVAFPRAVEWLSLVATELQPVDPNDTKGVEGLAALQAAIAAIDGDPVDMVADIRCGPDGGGGGGGGGGLPATGQTQCYDGDTEVPCPGKPAGQDGELQPGLARSFDDGNGTVTDLVTGLMWEKKHQGSGNQDWDRCYTWSGTCSTTTSQQCGRDADCPTGETCSTGTFACLVGQTVWQFLDELNDVANGGANCFAGHCDWRIPTVRELQSLVNYGTRLPATYDEFHLSCIPDCDTNCSCTKPEDVYWTSTTSQGYPDYAWIVDFQDGWSYEFPKDDFAYARAVRGGL